MNIRFYNHTEIDKKEWDKRIRSSLTPLIYAESVYLDAMAGKWCALMNEDKSVVMPVPLKKKWGISYAFQPPFAQQLGIFSRREVGDDEKNELLDFLTDRVKVVDLYLNYGNQLEELNSRANFILNLNRTFSEISDGFRKDLTKKGVANQLRYVRGEISEVFILYRQFVFPKVKNLSDDALDNFEQLCWYYGQKKRVVCRKVVSDDGALLSAAVCLMDEHRIYYNLAASSDGARDVDANAFLLYHLIAEFSGKPLIFDFEGSELLGVAFFFKKFGPEEQPYYEYKVNRLSPILKAGLAFRDWLR